MLDRESTFADKDIVSMLKEGFIPVAIDQWYTRNQRDIEGKFYQAIAKQGPRNDMEHTTQGFYVCDASGKLLGYNNNRHADPIRKIMQDVLRDFDSKKTAAPLKSGAPDKTYDRTLPKGAIVIRVNSQILDGYEKSKDRYRQIFQRSIARDNLWILPNELSKLAQGEMPQVLAERIARFHLIDNTRGEPLMWTKDDLKSVDIRIDRQGKFSGTAKLESGRSRYDVVLRGAIEFNGKELKRFDIVARGAYSGHGPYTGNAPEGVFPVAVAFRLADGSDIADGVAPQGTKGWLDGYLRPQ